MRSGNGRSQEVDDHEEKPFLYDETAQPYSVKTTGNYKILSVFLIFLFPAMGGLLFGYDIGATSAVVNQLQSQSYSGVGWHDTVAASSLLLGSITSIGMLGALIGSMICFKVGDELGRRRSLIVASLLFMFGSCAEYVSGNPKFTETPAISILMIGRCIYGIGCGFAMNGAPAYIGEMAPSEIRGLLVSMKEVFIVLGMVLGYVVGYVYSSVAGGWRVTYGVSSFVAVIMFVGE
jgi:MFS family permease